jgi:hypothetical protein
MTPPNAEQSDAYGQFHIVLKNIESQWKTVQDWDTATTRGQPITEDDLSGRQRTGFDLNPE